MWLNGWDWRYFTFRSDGELYEGYKQKVRGKTPTTRERRRAWGRMVKRSKRPSAKITCAGPSEKARARAIQMSEAIMAEAQEREAS